MACPEHEAKQDENYGLFRALRKEIGGLTGKFASHRKCHLAECAAIVGEVAVIPDLHGPTNRYFEVTLRKSWAKQFEAWLENPSKEDLINTSDEESDEDCWRDGASDDDEWIVACI